nr:MAG TPA: hypothetical protein [Caudoviricetes sp.]
MQLWKRYAKTRSFFNSGLLFIAEKKQKRLRKQVFEWYSPVENAIFYILRYSVREHF